MYGIVPTSAEAARASGERQRDGQCWVRARAMACTRRIRGQTPVYVRQVAGAAAGYRAPELARAGTQDRAAVDEWVQDVLGQAQGEVHLVMYW